MFDIEQRSIKTRMDFIHTWTMESIQIILCYRVNNKINYNYLVCTTRDKRYVKWDYSFILCETTATKIWSCKIKTQWRRLCGSHKGLVSVHRAWGVALGLKHCTGLPHPQLASCDSHEAPYCNIYRCFLIMRLNITTETKLQSIYC